MSLPDDLDARKFQVLKETFGFDGFRPGQERVFDALLSGQRVLAVMPTGAGKSLCYQVPALALGGLAVVVSPLLALMQDQVAALKAAGVAAESINSNQSYEDNAAVWRRAAAGELSLLYLSPERLMTARMLAALARLPVRMIAVDEAHCISQWGPAFRPEYEQLSLLRQHFPEAALAAMTATADEVTRTDICAKLFGGDATVFVSGFDRPNITLSVEPKNGKAPQLLDFLAGHRGESGIVYCLSRKKTDETAAELRANGITALSYHAGMDRDERQANQDRFITESGIVMVATIAFGMGIDKPDVRFVFHADIPGSVEAYYQEIGRAGRDGQAAEAVMLYGGGDIAMRRKFIEDEDSDEERRRLQHQRLNALITYCEASSCRRQTLLAYFGETSEPCGNCDLCLNPVALADGTVLGQKALSAVLRTGQRFGNGHVIDVLRGARTEKVLTNGHEGLPTFGVGADQRMEDWRSILRQLDAAGFIRPDMERYGALTVTEKGRSLLRGECTFHYRLEKPARGGKTAKPAAKTGEPESPLSEEDASLLGRLKALRLSLAKERGVPAYVIFPDQSLEDMVRRRPTTPDEFAEIRGVGASKLRDFADPFLGALNDCPVTDTA
ncbi:MAG: DNA helicase RecQ [Alphaproteobacteria bacterium]